MEKYGVQIDPKKVEDWEKDNKKKAPQKSTQNVPVHPQHGTEPFERTNDGKSKKERGNA